MRQSSKIDRTKHTLDKAMELKEKKNSMLPSKKMTGIMTSNPFHVIQNPEQFDMYSKLGVSINEIDDTAPTPVCSRPCSESQLFELHRFSDRNNLCSSKSVITLADTSTCLVPHSLGADNDNTKDSSHIEEIIMNPKQCNTIVESDEIEDNIWIDDYNKKKWGKHARKLFK
jgi:hypothetical protein